MSPATARHATKAKAKQAEDVDKVWRALADPTRRALLDLLAGAPRNTGDICEHFSDPTRGGLGRTGVMKHLDVLTDAGLVLVRREGRVRWNYLNPVPIQQVCDRWVSRHVRHIASSLAQLKEVAESGE